ncbi:MAG: glycosyltransferase family 2 protein, partial [Candidatus Saccharimonadales bacterium]
MSSVPELTIVIPTFNREDVLLNSIRDCLGQIGATIEIMVVDQSPEHSKKFQTDLKKLLKDPRLTYYRASPASVTAAKNFALEHVSTELVIFIDDDVQIPKSFARNHLDSHAKHPDVSAIGGRVLQEGFPILDEILHFDEYAVSKGVF